MPRKATKEKVEKQHADEITLRLHGKLITPEDFRKAVQSFTDLILQVTEQISRTGKKPVWNMSVRKGSSVLVARPVPDVETIGRARETIKSVRNGIGLLEKGHADVPHFTQKALIAARGLGELRAKPTKLGITIVEVGNGEGAKFPVTTRTVETVTKEVGAQKSAYGAIEGTLQTISNRAGFQFVVYEALTDRGVNCFVRPDMFRDAHAAFGKRVKVSGLIRYAKDGKPISIDVENVRVFKTIEEIGPIESFRGILKSGAA